ncbi:hypothetical protein HMI56_002295 [Coelomomyces lativittatus]|nr:hypothetical protein HMI56_002295 [Coelomomyces lativittatus]
MVANSAQSFKGMTPPSGYQVAIVKQIHSGDSLVLRTPHQENGEKIVSLAFLNCPRLASSKKNTEDEPFAFEARETLRRVLIGKEVAFKLEYTVPNSGREFCTILAVSPSGELVNIASLLLQKGYAKLREEKRLAADESVSVNG